MQKILRKTSLYDQKSQSLKKTFRSLHMNCFILITYTITKIGPYHAKLLFDQSAFIVHSFKRF